MTLSLQHPIQSAASKISSHSDLNPFYIFAFGRCFNPKQLALHMKYISHQFMHNLGIEPITLALLAPLFELWEWLLFETHFS